MERGASAPRFCMWRFGRINWNKMRNEGIPLESFSNESAQHASI
jgi:hypothetical protein